LLGRSGQVWTERDKIQGARFIDHCIESVTVHTRPATLLIRPTDRYERTSVCPATYWLMSMWEHTPRYVYASVRCQLTPTTYSKYILYRRKAALDTVHQCASDPVGQAISDPATCSTPFDWPAININKLLEYMISQLASGIISGVKF
jgi:hypothetical protein